jgi:ribosomal protein L11 methyltransferase
VRSWPAIAVTGLQRANDAAELLQGSLHDYAIAAVVEASDDQWRIFFNDAAARERALIELRARFALLRFEALDQEDEDWAARSQAALRAVHVGRIIVAPPWDAPITIVIRPSMGFGTGHHATTRLCLAALQRLELARCSVLDVGTGSAVLAIAASRLGAEDVTGIDDDADAIQAAWDNLSLNAAAQVSLIVGDVRSTELVPADVILANLTGGLLIQTAPQLRRLAKANARLILSGFMTDEEHDVLAAFAAFSVEHRAEEEGWVCVTLK